MHFNEVTVFYFVCKSTLDVLSRAVREVGCIIETLLKFSVQDSGFIHAECEGSIHTRRLLHRRCKLNGVGVGTLKVGSH